jgi:hypothetical protein
MAIDHDKPGAPATAGELAGRTGARRRSPSRGEILS